MDNEATYINGGLHHVVLIGFHHKKGCVVEYAYPPLNHVSNESGDRTTSYLPEEWKFLPSLAMPDGAHNFTEDVVYFHLPPRKDMDDQTSKDTVYCVSYCRQVDAKLLSQRDEHITRGTVQKSVVILSKVPAFGLIHAKLQLPLITNAFLENFSKKEVLKELFNQINMSLNVSDESQLFFGLSARKILTHFKHKLVVLFKLILLEKRVIFYTTPASELVSTILALLSLFPRMIEIGLSDSTNVCTKSRTLEAAKHQPGDDNIPDGNGKTEYSSASTDAGSFELVQTSDCADDTPSQSADSTEEFVIGSLSHEETVTKPPLTGQSISRAGNMMSKVVGKFGFLGLSTQTKTVEASDPSDIPKPSTDLSHLDPEMDDDETYMMKLGNARLHMDVDSPEKVDKKQLNTVTESAQTPPLLPFEKIPSSTFKVDSYGFPLSVFTHGHLCLPYVALQHHDLIRQNSRNGYVVGATNILFQTRKELSDAVVDVENGEIIFHDPNLQRQLALSAADLRFAEHIVTNILQQETEDFFNIATEWKGGDEWLRSLFAEYLHRMLCVTSRDDIDSKKVQDFNEAFINAWKGTKNFKIWKHGKHKIIENETDCQHLFHGQYSISDVRLRLHHRLQNSEQGRRLEGAISNANDTIVNTGRYIGSAFGSAKSSLSSWISSKVQTNKS